MADEVKITSGKQLAEFATELLDSEVQAAFKIIVSCQQRYAGLRNTVENLEKLRDEVITRLAEDLDILASFDPAPCFYGDPPVVEFIGKVNTASIHKDGFDHEQKMFEVKKATKRGEDFLGQKERVNARVPRKNDD